MHCIDNTGNYVMYILHIVFILYVGNNIYVIYVLHITFFFFNLACDKYMF